jgi:protein phosphatase 2C family protein 2/3
VFRQKSESGDGESLIFGTSSMQGWRISMEDAHACLLDLQASTEGGKPTEAAKRLAYFGVYDGHGGDKVAIYTGEHLHDIVTKQEAYKSGDLKKALQDGFLAADRAILSGMLLRALIGLLLTGTADSWFRSQV